MLQSLIHTLIMPLYLQHRTDSQRNSGWSCAKRSLFALGDQVTVVRYAQVSTLFIFFA